MVHWRSALIYAAVVALVAFAAIGGGFHWNSSLRVD
jgi:hypothetical protein